MSEVKMVDAPNIAFTSTVFPTDENKVLWARLSDEQRCALIERSEQAGFDSGVAERTSLDEILNEVRSER